MANAKTNMDGLELFGEWRLGLVSGKKNEWVVGKHN